MSSRGGRRGPGSSQNTDRGRGYSGGRGGGRGGSDSSDRGRGYGGGRGGGRGGSDSSDRGRGYGGGRGGGRGGSDSFDRGGGYGDGRGGGYPGQGGKASVSSRGGGPTQGAGPTIYLPGQALEKEDPEVQRLEDSLVGKTNGKVIANFPGRPGYGDLGKLIKLRTNHFPIKMTGDEVSWHRYNIEITPALPAPKRRTLIAQIIQDETRQLYRMTRATDYGSILVTTTKLSADECDFTQVLATHASTQKDKDKVLAPHQDAAQKRNTFQVKITFQQTFSLRHLVQWLKDENVNAVYTGCGDVIQLINIIMCQGPNDYPNIKAIGGHKFYPFEGHNDPEIGGIGSGLEALRGYYASVRPATSRLLLNLNVTAALFYKPLPLVELWNEYSRPRGSQPRTNDQWRQIGIFCRHIRFQTIYAKDGVPRTKCFGSFSMSPLYGNANQVKFKWNGPGGLGPERQNTVAEFFKQEYNITLKRPELPVVNVGTAKDPSWVPPELGVEVLPGQIYQRLVSGQDTSAMLKFAARPPFKNAESLAGTGVPGTVGRGLRIFRLAHPDFDDMQAETIKQWGFEVDTKMLTVPGRILTVPTLHYEGSKETPRFGAWNIKGKKFVQSGNFKSWQVITINDSMTAANAPVVDKFSEQLHIAGVNLGPRQPSRNLRLLPLNQPANRPRNDEIIAESFAQAEKEDIGIQLIALQENDRWLYARIKYWADVVHGISTVCCVATKFLREGSNQPMYFANLALKFNLKGSGVSHTVPKTLGQPIDDRTMLMGIDVTHPAPGNADSAPSIAAVVASVDKHMFHWPGSIRTQTRRQEMVDGLTDMFIERLELWRSKNTSLPNKIIVFRDGVSEGQYQTVLDAEIPPLEEAFKRKYGAKDKWPKLTVVIVGKRHHTRFFPTKVAEASRSSNPLPGTVVDRGITNKVLFEFYLQAHEALQGTARPAHYVVIKDDIGFTANQMQEFTHQLCYLFNRATKAVSIVPPAYYADLLAERGRCYLHNFLTENNSQDGSGYNKQFDWAGGVHERLANTTWYV